ncbi:MAG: N-acetylmuramoyl-L-alanine amidase [Dermatophilaceae bacterium]
MYLQFVLAALLTLTGLVVPAPHGHDSSGRQNTVVGHTVDRAGTATPERTLPAGASTGDARLTKLDIIVPPIEPSGTVAAPPVPLGAMSAGRVVADELVTARRVESRVVDATGFQTLGVTWPEGTRVGDLGGQVRTRSKGRWSSWVDLKPGDSGPDAGTADAARVQRGGTDPLSIGDADAVQLAFAATAKGGPQGLSLALIGSAEKSVTDGNLGSIALGTSAGSGASVETTAYSTSLVQTAAVAPRVITRAEWGAPAQACTPDVASALVGAVVHHTADPNTYTTVAQAMQQIRNDAAYHINGRGWCDIGYNFIVDKWGNIYEGRAHSMAEAVVGAHAAGFNTGTVGVSMLGTYDALPSAATQQSVAQIIAWRLRAYHIDPQSSMTYHTGDGGTLSKYYNQNVVLSRISGHRDVGYTACPGNGGYAALPNIRAKAHTLAGPLLVTPTLSATKVAQGTGVVASAKTISNLNWRLDISDARTGVAVNASIGYAQESSGGVIARWNGLNADGQVVGPGPYRMQLTARDSTTGIDVLPYTATVEVTGSQNPPEVSPVSDLGSNLRFVPITPARVLDTRPQAQSIGPGSRMDVIVAGVAGIPKDAKSVTLNITAANASTVTNIRAWPAGSPMPDASVLNADSARSASAAGIILGVGGQQKVSLYNNAGSTHLVVDVTGYYTSVPSSGFGYAQLPSALRALDTRASLGPMTSRERRTITVTGAQGVPADATAVVLNVTSVGPKGQGYISVFPSGGAVPPTSTVNHLPGHDVSNRTTVAVANGKVDVVLMGASADVVVDVVGWYGPHATLWFTPIQPTRAVDTRTLGQQPLGPGQARSFAVGAAAGLPPGASAASVTLTATQVSAPFTYLTAWQDGTTRPGTSDLNAARGSDQANMAIVGLGNGGNLELYNNAGTTHVVVDVTGYFK